jgi:hypothetical protein
MLQVWEAVVQNEGEGAKPFITNLLPFVVSPRCGRRRRRGARGDASTHTLHLCIIHSSKGWVAAACCCTMQPDHLTSAHTLPSHRHPRKVERLSDNRQEVRQAACNLMLEVLQCQVLRPEVMNDRLSRFWAHKHWKVRHGLLQFVAEAVCMMGGAALAARDAAGPKTAVTQVIRLVEDPER